MKQKEKARKTDKEFQLEKQVEDASLFAHTLLSLYANRINNIESFLYGMADALMKKEVVSKEEINKFASLVQKEIRENREHLHPALALRVDGKQKDKFVPVNCDERMHICKAVCCKLDFALSAKEVESGILKWELGRPYFIRHNSNGYCNHWSEGEKCCSIYDNRPPVCRRYSCAKDERIWKDFDKMELNQEWIDQFLGGKRPFLAEIQMDRSSNNGNA